MFENKIVVFCENRENRENRENKKGENTIVSAFQTHVFLFLFFTFSYSS